MQPVLLYTKALKNESNIVPKFRTSNKQFCQGLRKGDPSQLSGLELSIYAAGRPYMPL
jgi:hypothetical protein